MTDYATLAELKTQLGISPSDSTKDVELQAKLTAASRRVERDCGNRQFYPDTVATARQYDLTHPTKLIVDDISTASGLIVQVGYASTWTTIPAYQYRLLPENALVRGSVPWLVERVYSYWPLGSYPQAQVTAVWGWPAIPDDIKAATLLVAARLFRRKDSPEGVSGHSQLGQIFVSRYDPDYDWLISNFSRPEV